MSDYSQLLEQYRALDAYVSTRVSPGNVAVPYLGGDASVGGTLTCTMGEWFGMPTSYAYVFSGGGMAVDNTYTVDATDAGTEVTCIVTATNPAGSTAAPPSNAVAIAAAEGMAATEAAEEAPQRTPRTERNHERGRR